MIGVFVLLALLVVFGLFLSGQWQAPEQIKQQIMNLARKKTDSAAAFRAWAETSLGQRPELQAWLLALPEAGLAALAERLETFCADLNLRLAWLLGEEAGMPPELRQTMSAIVADYLDTCRRAVGHQHEFTLFDTYHSLAFDLADARHRDLRRRLFSRLAETGLAEALPTYDLIMASETQRQALAAEAIRAAASRDWRAFGEVLREVSAG